MSMEKRNIIEEGRTPGFEKRATAIPDDFEKKARDIFGSFRDRRPVKAKKKPIGLP